MFSGSIVALITPMHADGGVDYPALKRLVEWHLDSGTDGLVVLGTTGESATIEQAERDQMIAQVIEQVHEKIPVIVGTGANATAQAVALTQRAMELGADAALIVTPYYNKPTQEGLYQHFKTIAQAVPMPQILYNVPSRTGCDLLPETVGRLSTCSNIVGMKEATPGVERLQALKALAPSMDFLSGDDATACEFMLAGGRGVISVAANIVPTGFHEMCQAALAGDAARARALNEKLLPLYSGLSIQSNPIPAKWMLCEMGMIETGIRLPLTLLEAQYHAQVKAAMQAVGVHCPN